MGQQKLPSHQRQNSLNLLHQRLADSGSDGVVVAAVTTDRVIKIVIVKLLLFSRSVTSHKS